MSDATFGRADIGPATTQIVPLTEVAALVARFDAELGRLETDLELALREAADLEARLRDRPAALVIDDAFERAVLAAVEQHIASIDHSGWAEGAVDPAPLPRPVLRPRRAPAETTRPVIVDASIAADAKTADPIVEPVAPEPGATTDDRAHDDEPPRVAAAPSSIEVTRRSWRRGRETTVVTRPGARPAPPANATPAPPPVPAPEPATPPAPPAPPAPEASTTVIPAAVAVAVADAEPASVPETAPEADPRAGDREFWQQENGSAEPPATRLGGWPANLAIQAGVVLVVFALILFKLG